MLFAISFLSSDVKFHDYERLMSELGGAFGGTWVKYAVVITGSTLLLFAANTAIIGCSTPAEVLENALVASAASPMSDAEKRELLNRVRRSARELAYYRGRI